MQRCFELAQMGLGHVAPNPMVGAVVVNDGSIIGEGYHAEYGKEHAEVNAIDSVIHSDLLRSSTLYINLEPCCHHGKTPPCTDLILEKKIKRVVISNRDPFEKVNGRGVEILRAAGVEVIEDILPGAGRELNKRFFTFHEKKRPYIILKWAQSQDGFMDLLRDHIHHRPAKITDEVVDTIAHRWRSQEAVILVGARTVLLDNPKLTVRHVTGKNPVRVILDPDMLISGPYRIFGGEAPTYIFGEGHSKENVTYVPLTGGDLLQQVCDFAHQNGWNSIYVEGGSFTITQFIQAGLWDEMRVITNTALYLRDGIPAPKIPESSIYDSFRLDGQIIRIFRNAANFSPRES